jgi:c-di-GMP-binding flagellar brake protein YcgR
MLKETDNNQNHIQITDPFAVARHLNYITRIGLHCIITGIGDQEVNGKFVSLSDDKITINLLASAAIERDQIELEINYRLDNILHSFKSSSITRENDNIHLVLPKSILRYQIRRYDRVKVLEDKDLEVKFNLMTQKAEVKDISLGGIGLHMEFLPENFERNIRLNSIKLMLKKSHTMHLSGILRYIKSVDEEDKQLYRIGVEFDPLKEDDKSTLLDFIGDLET